MNFAQARKWAIQTAVLLSALALGACGGGSSAVDNAATQSGPTQSGSAPSATQSCDPANPATHSECGTVFVGLTDADGDFLNYTVDVIQLTLETTDGRVVNTLPQQSRINFSDYVDLTELLTAAIVPPGNYVSGTITLDYGDAEVFVEAGDAAKETVVTDLDGIPLAQTDLKIILSNRDSLFITRGRTSFLQLDFDLGASHIVDILPTPATAASEQFIVAEVTPVDEKEIRVRGPLFAVNEDASNYVIAIRPFHDRVGDFGNITVNVTSETEFDVNGETFVGSEGLSALGAAGQGTPTIAAGILNVADREFTASLVLAGSSVPGHDRDALVGNVIKRDGNFLTVRGATIIPRDRRAHFHDDVVVEIGPNTKVFKDGDRVSDMSINAISIGQRVTIRGTQSMATSDALAPQILFDATEGAVRMHLTNLMGIVNTVSPGQTDITLHAIDRRRVQIFDFAGTGIAADLDADPDNYEVATGDLTLADFAQGKPVAVKGFPTAFGMAPLDFTGRTVIDYTDVRSALGVGWGATGTLAPYLSAGGDGLLLDNQNADIDVRHHIKQGPVLTDLTALDSFTLIAPDETARCLYYIKSGDRLSLYSDFAEFVVDLNAGLNGATTARSMHARGHYDAATNVFSACKIGIYLLEP